MVVVAVEEEVTNKFEEGEEEKFVDPAARRWISVLPILLFPFEVFGRTIIGD